MSGKMEILAIVSVLLAAAIAVFVIQRRQPLSIRIFCALVLILFLAILIPNLLPARMTSAQNACVNCLQIIQAAKVRWAEINHKGPSDIPTEADLFSETHAAEFSKGTGFEPGAFNRMPSCPAGGHYIIGAVKEEAQCSIGPPDHTLHPSR
jgi:hypothetical protein